MEITRDELLEAALRGEPEAQYLYSLYLEGGIGVAPDLSESLRFCILAANGNHCPAAHKAASMLEQGIGVAINLEEAFHWYNKAAELGDVDSAASIGRMYASGAGVGKDELKALEWFEEGRRRGSPWALYALSSAYRFGELGQPIDSSKADEFGEQAVALIKERTHRAGT